MFRKLSENSVSLTMSLSVNSWVSFLTREVMETATTYQDARDALASPRLLAPVYFILAGTQPGEVGVPFKLHHINSCICRIFK